MNKLVSITILSLLALLSFLAEDHFVQSFVLESPRKMTEMTSLSNRKKCGPDCRTISIDQFNNGSSETCPLTLSGGASNYDVERVPASTSGTLREMVAEFVGTFIIVQLGCGTVCSAIFQSAQVGLWQIAAVWSIAVTLAISATASISGAHLNPAITLALATCRGFSWGKVVPFILSQLFGAIAAAGVNFALFHDSIVQFEAANNIIRGTVESVKSASAFGEYWSVTSWVGAFFAEAYGTAMLAFMIFALTNPKNETTTKSPHLIPPLIGLTVGALISVIAPLTQAGFNPARDFGPRIVSLICGWKGVAMKGWWVYVFAPIIGATLGGQLADRVLFR